MKTEIASTFFESIKNLDSWKSKWYSLLGWFKYHFNKENNYLIKTAWKGRPWDISFLYDLEKAKIEEMIAYHTKADRYVGVEDDIKLMKLCVKLIDIFTEKPDLFNYTGELKFKKLENGNYEVDGSELVYHCYVKVNTKNAGRFIPLGDNNPHIEYWKNHPHEIYILKAKALYHKIRNEKDGSWWD